MKKNTTVIIFLLLISSLTFSTSCLNFGTGSGYDCQSQRANYQYAESQEGILIDQIPNQGPYPMAMVLSQDAVNKLLWEMLDHELPPISVTDPITTLTLTAYPELPMIQIESVNNCHGCVITDMNFGIEVSFFGISVAGSGGITVSLPIELVPNGNASTILVAGMDRATFLDIDLNIMGLDSNQSQLVESIMEEYATLYIRQEFGATNLITLNSWDIGNGDVLLAARGPVVLPEYRSIIMGLHTNLDLSPTATLEEQAYLPEGVEMSLQFHPELLLAMSQRMLNEGEIPRDYDMSGNEDSTGDHHVTLTAMQTGETGKLNTIFRLWRTGGGLCGFVDISSDFACKITGDSVAISVDNIQVIHGEGIGELFNANTWIASDFINALLASLELTVNYGDIEVDSEGTEAIPNATALLIDGRGITIHLDLALD